MTTDPYPFVVTTGLEGSRPTYLQVADALRHEILRGEIGRGERLPSVRDLASRFDIAAVTVQNALRVLRDEGYVASRSTRGYFVRDELPIAGPPESSNEFTAIRDQLDALTRTMRELGERVSDLEATVRPGDAPPPPTPASERKPGD